MPDIELQAQAATPLHPWVTKSVCVYMISLTAHGKTLWNSADVTNCIFTAVANETEKKYYSVRRHLCFVAEMGETGGGLRNVWLAMEKFTDQHIKHGYKPLSAITMKLKTQGGVL